VYSLTFTQPCSPPQLEAPLFDLTVGDVLRATAVRTPDAIALIESEQVNIFVGVPTIFAPDE
jgi:hypothetical protein